MHADDPIGRSTARQIRDAMDQYLRLRPASPRDTPLLRGGGKQRRLMEEQHYGGRGL